MSDDFMQELRQIQQYAAGMKHLMDKADSNAPAQAEGTDSSGVVHVALGADGFPESIRVAQNWKKKLDPAAFGGAVGEAFSAAMGERITAWTSALQESGWQSDFENLRSGGTAPSAPESGTVPPAFRKEPQDVPARPLDALTEDMMSALERADASTNQETAPAEGTGSVSSGRLTITLSKAGGLSCEANAQWVSQHSAAQLTTYLADALAAAREDLATATREDDGSSQEAELNQIYDEALSLLNNPDRIANL